MSDAPGELAAWLSTAVGGREGVVFIDPPAPLRAALRGGAGGELDGTLRPGAGAEALDALTDASLEGIVLGVGRGMDVRALAARAAAKVRPGGTLALAAPTRRAGWRGARARLLGRLHKRRPLSLEELCEALLFARLVDPLARELADPTGLSVVWARRPAPLSTPPRSARSGSPPSAG